MTKNEDQDFSELARALEQLAAKASVSAMLMQMRLEQEIEALRSEIEKTARRIEREFAKEIKDR